MADWPPSGGVPFVEQPGGVVAGRLRQKNPDSVPPSDNGTNSGLSAPIGAGFKIFVCWSSESSRSIALALSHYLKAIDDDWDVWVSEEDIRPGRPWRDELFAALETSSFGIVCADPSALKSPWVHFEAGALSATIGKKGVVCPYLVNLSADQLSTGPLADFQSVPATEEGTFRLVKSILSEMGRAIVDETRLRRRCGEQWIPVRQALNEAKPPNGGGFPSLNCLDLQGLEALLDIHLAATMGRLTFVVDRAIERGEGGIPMKKLLKSFERDALVEVSKRRTKLAPFHVQGLGRLIDFIDQNLPEEELRKRIKKARSVLARSSNPKEARHAAYMMIDDEQTRLKQKVALDIAGIVQSATD